MKKQNASFRNFCFLAVLLTCLFAGGSLYAQEQQTIKETKLTPKIGVKGGVNLSNLYVDEVEDENMRVGFNLGLFAKLPVSKGFSIQPEFLYNTKGAKLSYNNFVLGQGDYRFNLNYLEVPVLGVVNVTRNFNMHFGLYGAYLTSANITDVNSNGSIDEIADLDEDDFNRFDMGLIGGLGFDVGNCTIGARYGYGLKDVGKSGSLAGELTRNSRNSNISFYFGFGF